MKRIVILASGSGSNARAILNYFNGHPSVRVAAIVTNNKNAKVLNHARDYKIPGIYLGRSSFKLNASASEGTLKGDDLAFAKATELKKHTIPKAASSSNSLLQPPQCEATQMLLDLDTDLIVLAGFLWMIPADMVAAFPNRIVNIHPALLPKHGGKGMYGMNVHRAVIATGDTEAGLTIHYVNERYDEGAIIEQARLDVYPDDDAESIAARVLKLEHATYAPVIERILAHEPE